MKKIYTTLSIALAVSLWLPSTAYAVAGAAAIMNTQSFKDEHADLVAEMGHTEQKMVYTLIREEVIGDSLVRTYVEDNEPEELWYTIDMPKEISKEVHKMEDQEEKIKKAYELLATLYVQTDSWLKLNILAEKENDLYPVTNIKVKEEMERETAKKLKIVLKKIKNKEKNEKLTIENQEQYIDNEIDKERYRHLSFDSVAESEYQIQKDIKEYNKVDFLGNLATGLIIAVIIGIVVYILKKRG